VRYLEQAHQFLPNSSRIPESLPILHGGEASGPEASRIFNEAERLDPGNVNLLTQHAISYIDLRRFPEALRSLIRFSILTPDDVDTLVAKADIAQAEGNLPQAAALLVPLHPAADETNVLEAQVYQAILERRPGQVIPRVKEILASLIKRWVITTANCAFG